MKAKRRDEGFPEVLPNFVQFITMLEDHSFDGLGLHSAPWSVLRNLLLTHLTLDGRTNSLWLPKRMNHPVNHPDAHCALCGYRFGI